MWTAPVTMTRTSYTLWTLGIAVLLTYPLFICTTLFLNRKLSKSLFDEQLEKAIRANVPIMGRGLSNPRLPYNFEQMRTLDRWIDKPLLMSQDKEISTQAQKTLLLKGCPGLEEAARRNNLHPLYPLYCHYGYLAEQLLSSHSEHHEADQDPWENEETKTSATRALKLLFLIVRDSIEDASTETNYGVSLQKNLSPPDEIKDPATIATSILLSPKRAALLLSFWELSQVTARHSYFTSQVDHQGIRYIRSVPMECLTKGHDTCSRELQKIIAERLSSFYEEFGALKIKTSTPFLRDLDDARLTLDVR
jgi:hypothetical protein